MIDYLFLSKDCPDCAMVLAVLDMNAVISDDFRGKDGQEFLVFSGLSNNAAKELLSRFDFSDNFTPLLVSYSGKKLDKPANIIAYLHSQGMAILR